MGVSNDRRIPLRQRVLHPSMLSVVDLAFSSSSDPGQGGYLSPFNSMKSLYFDNSLYENKMHYKISKYLDELKQDPDSEELVIKCDNEEQYNSILDSLFKAADGKLKICGTSNNPLEIIVEKDPHDSYRKFDEKFVLEEEDNDK